MFKKIILVVISSVFYCSGLLASTDSLDEFIQALSVHQRFSADFSQITLSDDGVSLSEVHGSMQMQRPNRFYWSALPPQEQEVISNGKTLWVYDIDLEQVTIQHAGNNLDESPAVILSGNRELITRQYAVTLVKTNKNVEHFRLIPTQSSSTLTAIDIYVETGVIRQLRFEDSLGQTTLIELSNYDVTPEFSSDLFDFVAPRGVDVLDQR